MNTSRNLAARAAHWSAGHRKTAIFGWLAFVVVAAMLGNAVGKNMIQGADMFSGEAGRAEQTLYDAGLRPNTEHVLIQSKELTVDDPEFKAAIEEAAARLSRTEDVRNVLSPLTGDAPVSADKHSALVQFDITGDSLEAAKRLDPSKEVVSEVKADHPELLVEQFGSVSSNKELNDTFASDLAKAELLSFPLTLLILVLAFGALVAALVPLLLGVTTVIAALGLVALPSHLSPIDSNLQSVILLIGLAVSVDYSLFYLRREREERAAGRSERSALEVAAATSGRAVLISGLTVIDGDGRHVPHRRQDLHLVRPGDDPRGGHRDRVVADGPTGRARLARRSRREGSDPLPRPLPAPGRTVALLVGAGRSRHAPALAGDRARGRRLIALSIPALNMNIAVTTTDDLPQDLAVVKTFDRVREAFPAEAVTVDVAVKADDVRTGAAAEGISDLRAHADGSLNMVLGEGGRLQQGRYRRARLHPHQGQWQRRAIDGRPR